MYRLLLSFCISIQAVYAVLGVQKDDVTASPNYKWVHYSAISKFGNRDTATLAQQLPFLAQEAYAEMYNSFGNDNVDQNVRPAVMSALLIDQTVYFSSSLKGAEFTFSEKTNTVNPGLQAAVKNALIQCQRDKGDDSSHQNRGACGEVVGCQMALLDDPELDIARATAKVVSYTRQDNNSPSSKYSAPCGSNPEEDNWGCRQFLDKLHIQILDPPAQGTTAQTLNPTHVSYKGFYIGTDEEDPGASFALTEQEEEQLEESGFSFGRKLRF